MAHGSATARGHGARERVAGDYLARTDGWEYWKDDWEALGSSVERIESYEALFGK